MSRINSSNKPVKATKPPEIERNITVNGTYIRVKSIFGDIPLDKALANIAKRRLAESKRSDKT